MEVEQIRKVRAETANIKAFTKDEIEDFFGEKIKKQIDESISEKLEELLANYEGKVDRKNELHVAAKKALQSLFSRIERGMIVEIRLLAETTPEYQDDDGDSDSSETNLAGRVKAANAALMFPPPSDNPILEIPLLGESEDGDKKDKKK